MDVIKRLNDLRLKRNMSVYRLAELSGINQSTLANTFSRKTVPSIKNLELMCDALGVTLSQFFAEEGEPISLSQQEYCLISNFRTLDKETEQSISKLLESIKKFKEFKL